MIIQKRVLIALPAFNEEATVGEVIEKIPENILGYARPDILVVDDGSTDETPRIARQAGAKVVTHGRNMGLGEAFRTALRYSRENGYHIMITIDADGQFDPADIPELIDPLMKNRADFVTASRFSNREFIPEMPRLKKWGNLRVAKLVSNLSGIDIKDATCGFRAYGPAALEVLSSFSRFTYTQEVIIDLASKGLSIVEVPIKVLGERPVGSSRIAGNLWKYAILSLAAMFSIAHDHRPWKFYGTPAILLLSLGMAGNLFVFVRWLFTGLVRPFAGVAIGGLFLVTFSVLLFLFASLADTASHNRHLLESIVSENVRKNRLSIDNKTLKHRETLDLDNE